MASSAFPTSAAMTDDKFVRSAIKALKKLGMTAEQQCVLYLRIRRGMDIPAIAAALKMDASKVECIEGDLHTRILEMIEEMSQGPKPN